jgi:hypothetical protein
MASGDEAVAQAYAQPSSCAIVATPSDAARGIVNAPDTVASVEHAALIGSIRPCITAARFATMRSSFLSFSHATA